MSEISAETLITLEQALASIYDQQRLIYYWEQLHRRNMKKIFIAVNRMSPKLTGAMKQKQSLSEALVNMEENISMHSIVDPMFQHPEIAHIELRLSLEFFPLLTRASSALCDESDRAYLFLPAAPIEDDSSPPPAHELHTKLADPHCDADLQRIKTIFEEYIKPEAYLGLLLIVYRWVKKGHNHLQLANQLGSSSHLPTTPNESQPQLGFVFLELLWLVVGGSTKTDSFFSSGLVRPKLRNILVILEDIVEKATQGSNPKLAPKEVTVDLAVHSLSEAPTLSASVATVAVNFPLLRLRDLLQEMKRATQL